MRASSTGWRPSIEFEDGLGDEGGPAVVLADGAVRRGRPGRRSGRGRAPVWTQAWDLGGDAVAEVGEELVFEFLGAFLGAEDLVLVFLELGGDVAFGVLDGLLADVVGRDLGALGVGDLDVVAEDLVEADLEAGDAGAPDLFGLEAGDPGLAAAGGFAELVEERWSSRRERGRRRGGRGAGRRQGFGDGCADFRAEFEAGFEFLEARGVVGRRDGP